LAPSREWVNSIDALRRFGLALVRDGRTISDEGAIALVDKLCRQASLSIQSAESKQGFPRQFNAYVQLVRLYRRHVRKADWDDGHEWIDEGGPLPRRPHEDSMAGAIRALPLELREAILLVVLAGFSHRDAALALEIPMTALIERLLRAREKLGASPVAAATMRHANEGAPYLRLVK